MNKNFFVVAIGALLFFGCSGDFVEPEIPSEPASSSEISEDISASEDEIMAVVDANNQFAFELYSEYKTKAGNIFFSPFSISTALAMTFEGARGQTADEMQEVFHFPADEKSRQTAFAEIFREINRDDESHKLSIANALWAQQDYEFLAEYFCHYLFPHEC